MANDTLVIRPELISRLKSAFNDQHYHDAMANSSKYNAKLVSERKLRLPFLDAQTGVAQSDSFIWMSKVERMPGHTEEQLYSYPAKRWRKKRRQYLMNDNYLTRRNRESEIIAENEAIITAVENGKPAENGDNLEKFVEDSKESWLREFDDGSDLPDAGELDDPESDYDDYEEYSTRKKRKKKDTPKRKRVEYSDAEKPYSCDICGARYKTRPGLSYHYSHSHQNDSAGNGATPGMRGEEEDIPYTPPRQMHHNNPSAPIPASSSSTSSSQPNTSLQSNSMPLLSSQLSGQQHPLSSQPPQSQGQSHSRPPSSLKSNGEESEGAKSGSANQPASPSQYCDFCLGDSVENKKTKSAEDLVSCADCGRSAHPTCLQFTPNMIISVKKYKWQCIECKSCGLCGTSDNDDQLLFCDDCDRGYHMYCLKPPLSEPPEGSWSCHLCIEEYHTPKK